MAKLRMKQTISGKQVTNRKFPLSQLIGAIVVAAIVYFAISYATPNVQSRGLNYFVKNLKNFFSYNDLISQDGIVHTASQTFHKSISLMGDTIIVSIAGTIIGLFASIPFAYLSSKVTARTALIYRPARVVFSIFRAFPPVTFAYIFVIYLQPTLAGTLTIAIFVATVMSKWVYELIDQLPEGPNTSYLSIGGKRSSSFLRTIFPQIRKEFISLSLYSFEMVIRFSAILGVINIVGIGILLNDFKGDNPDNYGMLGIVIGVIIVTVIIIEILAYLLNRFILDNKGKTFDKDVSFIETKVKSPKRWIVNYTLVLILFALTIYSFSTIKWGKALTPVQGHPFSDLFHPDTALLFDFGNANNAIILALKSLGIVAMSIILGVLFAIPFGLMASTKITNKYIAAFFKLIIIVIRSIPSYVYVVWFMLFSNRDHFAFAGALALGFHSIGMLGKLIATSADSIDNEELDSMKALGAGKFQILKKAIWPKVAPSILTNMLYRVEINFKTLTLLGVVGASAFGYQYNTFLGNPQRFSQASSFIIVTIVFVLIIEFISNFLVRKVKTGWFTNFDFEKYRDGKERIKSRMLYTPVWRKISKAETVTICTHIDTDGDTIGSAIALKHLILDNTKVKEVKISGEPYPGNLSGFEKNDKVSDEYFKDSLVIVVDTSNKSRIFDKRVVTEKSIKIDHHHREEKWLRSIGGDNWPATGQILFEMSELLKLEVSPIAAEAILMAIWTDTEEMSQRNPSNLTKIAVRAMAGKSTPIQDLKKKIELSKEEKNIISDIRKAVIQKKDLAYFVYEKELPNSLFRHTVSRLANEFDQEVFLGTAPQNGSYRGGLRSKGNVDVSIIAKKLGGGGHFASSGFKVNGKKKWNETISKILVEF